MQVYNLLGFKVVETYILKFSDLEWEVIKDGLKLQQM